MLSLVVKDQEEELSPFIFSSNETDLPISLIIFELIIMSSAEEKVHKKKKRTRDEENDFAEVANVVEPEVVEDDDAERKRRKKEKKERRRLQELAAKEAAAVEETSTAMEVADEDDANEEQRPKKDKKKKDKKDKHEKATPVVYSTTSDHLASINNHYVEHPSTAAQSTSNVDSKHEEWNITIHPAEEKYLYKPITNFEYLTPSLQRTCQYVLDYIRVKQFTQPTPIQVPIL